MPRRIGIAQSESGTWHRAPPNACEAASVAADLRTRRRVTYDELQSLSGSLCSTCFRERDGSAEPPVEASGDPGPEELRATVEDLLADPPLSWSDPLTAVTGLGESVPDSYAARDHGTGRPCFGRDTSVRTVGELLCSDATLKGVAHSWLSTARRQLLAVAFTPEVAARVVREYDGPPATLFGTDPDGFDPATLDEHDCLLLRNLTAWGAGGDRPRASAADLRRDAVRDRAYRASSLYRRSSLPAVGAPPESFDSPSTVTPVLETSRGDVVVVSTAPDPSTLAEEGVAEHPTTHVRAEALVDVSLLLGANFLAAPWDGIAFRTAERASLTEGETDVYCVLDPGDGDYCFGLTTPLDGDLGDSVVRRLLREQVL